MPVTAGNPCFSTASLRLWTFALPCFCPFACLFCLHALCVPFLAFTYITIPLNPVTQSNPRGLFSRVLFLYASCTGVLSTLQSRHNIQPLSLVTFLYLQVPVTAGKWYGRDMADVAAAEAQHGGSKKFAGGHGGVAKVRTLRCSLNCSILIGASILTIKSGCVPRLGHNV